MNSDVWMTILQETDVKTVGRMASVSKLLSLISERDEIWFQFAKLKYDSIYTSE
jgi:hypothetical protein